MVSCGAGSDRGKKGRVQASFEPTALTAHSKDDGRGPLPRPRILVADDEANMRDYLTRLLSSRWIVEAVPDGEAALAAAQEKHFDLVLTDAMTPGLDGFGLLRAVRANPALRFLPVIMLSAQAGEESRIEALHAGADDYLSKPFSAREVLARIRTQLKLSARRRLAAENAALVRLHKVSARLVREEDLPTLLQAVIDAAITVSDAAMGTLQLYDAASNSLRLVAQRGFKADFLERFATVREDDPAVCGEALRRGDRVIVYDVLHNPILVDAPAMQIMRNAGVRAVQSTPLRARDGCLLGMIATHWTEPHRPDVGVLRILDLLAREAADLIEHRQREEALRKSEAKLALETEALGRLNEASSRLWQMRSLQEGLDEILAATIELVGADMGNVQLLESDKAVLTIAAHRGFGPEFLDFFREVTTLDGSACGRALRSGGRIVIEDVDADPAYAPYRSIARAAGYRSVQSTPLIGLGGAPLGMLSTHFRSPYHPSQQDLRRLDLYARQAADFIERWQVDEALRESRTQLEAELSDTRLLQSISAELFHEDDVQVLYEKIVDAAARIMKAERASLQMIDDSSDERFKLLAAKGFAPEDGRLWECMGATAKSACAAALQQGQRIIASDLETCAFVEGSENLASCLKAGIRACQTTPLCTRSGEIVGMITTHWRAPHAPSERDWRLWDILARQAADLIERKRNQEALREADRRKDEFLATLAHELRNPLAPLRNILHVLKISGGESPSAERLHGMMERQVNQLTRLTDELLEVARITSGKIQLQKRPVALADIIRSAIETSQPLIEATQHKLVASVPAEPLHLEADPVRLTQVFANLLNNAAKYMDAGGEIHLTVEEQNDQVVVRVRDRGFGIAADSLLRIFDLFSQVDRNDGRPQGGLGIGLALARQLVELHGGHVEARSAGLGQGSEFTVWLPLAVAPMRNDPVEAHFESLGSLHRILVVDDNRDAAESLSLLLQSLGAETQVAFDGLTALAALKPFAPSAILLDLGMPGMNGYEVARTIRQRPGFENVPLIALTGWGQEEDRRRTRMAGFDHHLTKPADLGVLQGILAALEPRGPSGS